MYPPSSGSAYVLTPATAPSCSSSSYGACSRYVLIIPRIIPAVPLFVFALRCLLEKEVDALLSVSCHFIIGHVSLDCLLPYSTLLALVTVFDRPSWFLLYLALAWRTIATVRCPVDGGHCITIFGCNGQSTVTALLSSVRPPPRDAMPQHIAFEAA